MPFSAPLLQLDIFAPQVPEDSGKKAKGEVQEKLDFKYRKGYVQVNCVLFSGGTPVMFYLPKETPISVVKEKIPKKLTAGKDCYWTDAP